MTTTNHISPSGGQSERPKDDAISRSKRILELIDIYVERPDRMNRNALRSHLFDEFTEAAGIAQTGEDAANGAIGEREAFGSIHEFLGIASKRLYPTPDKPNSDWAKLRAAVDALALLEARAALTAEKVAAEPTSIPFSAYRLKVAEECCERLMSACTDSGCPDGVNMADWIRQLAAPQQPAQSAEQDERAAFATSTTRRMVQEHSGQSFYGSVGDLASSPRRIHAIHGNATSTDTGGADARAHQENRRRAFLGRQMYDGR
jgi:hypothetical protein